MNNEPLRSLEPAGRRRSPSHGRVLLTGATGVVGQAVLPRLTGVDVTCLVHRTPVERPGVTSVRGDLAQDRFGLPPQEYARLADRVDTVVHCAAVTEFSRADGSLEATNVGGTEEVVRFAERAGAHLVHVSTAYLHAGLGDDDRAGAPATRYAASKRAGEAVVQASGVPHVILRPSIVIGDSRDGAISAFQGIYLVAAAIFDGYLPVVPFDPDWPVDLVPCDVVAGAVVEAVSRRLPGAPVWVTAGEDALSLREAVEVAVARARAVGVAVDTPRFVPPDVFERLFAPVFLEALPRRMRIVVVRLLEFFGAYLAMDGPLPSSLDLDAAPALADPRAALAASLGFWAAATGRAGEPAARGVA